METSGPTSAGPPQVAHDDNKSPEAHLAMKARMPGGPRSTVTSLNVASKLWPTPCANNEKGGYNGHSKGGQDLAHSARTFPSGRPAPTTPADGDGSSPSTPTSRRVLSPRFVEALMGWPPGWTDCASSEMAVSLSRWRSRSTALLAALGCGES